MGDCYHPRTSQKKTFFVMAYEASKSDVTFNIRLPRKIKIKNGGWVVGVVEVMGIKNQEGVIYMMLLYLVLDYRSNIHCVFQHSYKELSVSILK